MFGWPSAHSSILCRRAPATPVPHLWRRVSPLQLARHLPRLGLVLHLTDARPAAAMDAPPPGWLAGQRELAPLLHAHWLAVAGLVGDDGPREWLECLDRRGRVQARIHLLPDTDYLAWDALLGLGEPAAAPAFVRPRGTFRPALARVTRFQCRRVAGLRVFGRAPGVPVSPLGREVARRIARDEAAALDLPANG